MEYKTLWIVLSAALVAGLLALRLGSGLIRHLWLRVAVFATLAAVLAYSLGGKPVHLGLRVIKEIGRWMR